VRTFRILIRLLLVLVISFGVLEVSLRLAGARMPRERGIEGSELRREAGVPEASWARHLLDDSRVLRALRMWRQDREMDRLLATTGSYVAPDAQRKEGDRVWGDHRRDLFGDEFVFQNVQGETCRRRSRRVSPSSTCAG
jgi:hypothetical protein